MVDFVEICNVCVKKAIIEATKRIINSDKICRSYSDLNFGVTFLEHSVFWPKLTQAAAARSLRQLSFLLGKVASEETDRQTNRHTDIHTNAG